MRAGALHNKRGADLERGAHLELVRQSVTTAATLAHERTLPVVADLAALVPSGCLQRGNTLAIHGVGATSFALAIAGQAIRQGSFLAIVAPESFGLGSCLDFDIPLRRVVQFVLPSTPVWGQAVAAIIEGFDVVLLADRHKATVSQARQLVARNRERGSVLIRVGGASWPEAADLRFDVSRADWSGLGEGYGHLEARQVSVQVAGRRYHGTSRSHQLLLPAFGGGVERVQPLSRPVSQPLVAAAVEGSAPFERFAGSDIDAMLDVVDARSGAVHLHEMAADPSTAAGIAVVAEPPDGLGATA